MTFNQTIIIPLADLIDPETLEEHLTEKALEQANKHGIISDFAYHMKGYSVCNEEVLLKIQVTGDELVDEFDRDPEDQHLFRKAVK